MCVEYNQKLLYVGLQRNISLVAFLHIHGNAKLHSANTWVAFYLIEKKHKKICFVWLLMSQNHKK